ncbi:hypothetical protein QJ054_33640 [Streptomyces sp. AN-3]|uniref:hypothetical protein n=1 Tax=Streptomyces sp. AN-3 TaxID=3044177 RepID=UPI00249A7004|nr:hypothetical protein [Streptomyces sp. AN-3]MDI3101980.1 hypothetical protein [Streptomyces sp. AN-3]
MTRAAWDATPTDYQARLLLAALADPQHRIPSDARKRTLEIMSGRHEWVQERRLTSTLAFAESNVRDWVLTHHGVNAANKVKAAQGNAAEKRARTVAVEGIAAEAYPANQAGLAAAERDLYAARKRLRAQPGLTEHTALTHRCAQLRYRMNEIVAVLNGSYANVSVAPTFTYGLVPEDQDDRTRCCIECGNFAEGLLEVVHTASGVSTAVCLAHDDLRVRDRLTEHVRRQELNALTKRFPAGAAAFFTPEGTTERDVVVVNSGPDRDGTVEVLSMNQGGAPLRAPLAALEELPELPPEPEGEITDWWTITDAQGAELTRVQAEDDPRARKAAERHPAVVAAIRRDKGFAVRRLRTSELSVPVGELPGAPRFSPAAEKPARTVPAAAPARRTITVRTEYQGRSIPSRLKAAGAPGQMQYSRKAGALRWVLPDGEELTPGQAAKRYLDA